MSRSQWVDHPKMILRIDKTKPRFQIMCQWSRSSKSGVKEVATNKIYVFVYIYTHTQVEATFFTRKLVWENQNTEIA